MQLSTFSWTLKFMLSAFKLIWIVTLVDYFKQGFDKDRRTQKIVKFVKKCSILKSISPFMKEDDWNSQISEFTAFQLLTLIDTGYRKSFVNLNIQPNNFQTIFIQPSIFR